MVVPVVDAFYKVTKNIGTGKIYNGLAKIEKDSVLKYEGDNTTPTGDVYNFEIIENQNRPGQEKGEVQIYKPVESDEEDPDADVFHSNLERFKRTTGGTRRHRLKKKKKTLKRKMKKTHRKRKGGKKHKKSLKY